MENRRDFIKSAISKLGMASVVGIAAYKNNSVSAQSEKETSKETRGILSINRELSEEYDKSIDFLNSKKPDILSSNHKYMDINLEYWSHIRSEIENIVNEESLARKILIPDNIYSCVPRYSKNLNAQCYVISKRGAISEHIMEGTELFVPTFEIGTEILRKNIYSSNMIADKFINKENDELINGLLKHTSEYMLTFSSFDSACSQMTKNGFTPKFVLKNGNNNRSATVFDHSFGDGYTIYQHPDIPREFYYVCADPNEYAYAVMPIRQNIIILPISDAYNENSAVAYEEVGFAILDHRGIVKVINS